ncbi:MAG: hypothetical protein PF904_05870 [Kiritimatiellae bacterium]|jgi:hypothetical protein|nr:hypothetical protein [Kiritimatiellia bacterium]
MNKIIITLFSVFGAVFSTLAVQQTNTVNATVDTRDYVITYISPYGDVFPSSGAYTTSWRGSAYTSVLQSPLFDQEGTILRLCAGFSGEGIFPSSGSGTSTTVKLTNVVSTLTWNWDSSFWVTWSLSGLGDISGSPYGSGGGWYNEGQSYLFRARPDYGWLFTGWSGAASGDRSTSNFNFTATAPGNLHATFSDDADDDGLKNTNEWAIGTSAWLADSDNDKFSDKLEFDNGGNPTVSDNWRLSHIQDNPDDFGLYTSNAVLNVALGEVLIGVNDLTAELRLQLEESDDLNTWTNSGPAEVWTRSVDSDKKFFRVRSSK